MPRRLLALLLGAAAFTVPAAAQEPQAATAPAHAADLGSLFEAAITFPDFLEGAQRRRDAWHEHYERGAPTHQALQRARAVGGQLRFLVVAEDWCGDSVTTIPYLARLVEAVDGWDLRVIDSQRGAEIIDTHRTPDGRSATPTVLVIDSDDREIGAWVERPQILQEWFLRSQDDLGREDLYAQKYKWYAEDAGEETVRELTEVARQALQAGR